MLSTTRRNAFIGLTLLAAICVFVPFAIAQDAAHQHAASSTATTTSTGMMQGGMHGMMGSGGDHDKQMQQMMQQMTQHMNSMLTQGDPDVNFAGMMAHHHESGIAMAREYLKHGKDEKLRKMAEKMIDEQGKEIKGLQERKEANQKNDSDDKKDSEKSEKKSE